MANRCDSHPNRHLDVPGTFNVRLKRKFVIGFCYVNLQGQAMCSTKHPSQVFVGNVPIGRLNNVRTFKQRPIKMFRGRITFVGRTTWTFNGLANKTFNERPFTDDPSLLPRHVSSLTH